MNRILEQRLVHMHLAGGAQAEAAALVEEAVAETLDDLDHRAHEALCDIDCDVIFGADRQEEFDRLLDLLAEALDDINWPGKEHPVYKAFFQLSVDMAKAQHHTDEMFDLVDKMLRGIA